MPDMNSDRNRYYKPGLLILALLLLAAVFQAQRSLNRERSDPALGLTGAADLGSNAPPVLAFTTVALGGFRGLIANALWMRATDLQDQGKYFEMVQLADWITKLEPHFVQVWLVQAWNMAYNISVKFTNPADRWRWVRSGIELLRDEGLRYNPKEPLIYRELGWFFQHKMGQNMDDAHVFYKLAWMTNMNEVLGSGRPDFDALISPVSAEDKRRARILRDKYKLNPEVMKEVDEQYGPLEWHLPSAHAVYWGYYGLQHSKDKRLITLRRLIYQSLHLAVLQGRLVRYSTNAPPTFGPNLDIVDHTNAAYEEMIRDDEKMRQNIKTAHRNFLREVCFLLYAHNRIKQARHYFELMKKDYPDSLPAGLSLDEYALTYLGKNITTLSQNQTRTVLEGLLNQSLMFRALGDDDQADGYYLMARRLHEMYDKRRRGQTERLGLPSIGEMMKPLVERMLDPKTGLSPELAARLRTSLGLP